MTNYKTHLHMPNFDARHNARLVLCGQNPGHEVRTSRIPSEVTCRKCISLIKYISRSVCDDKDWPIEGAPPPTGIPDGATHVRFNRVDGPTYYKKGGFNWLTYFPTSQGWANTGVPIARDILAEDLSAKSRVPAPLEDLYVRACLDLAELREELAKIRKKHKKARNKLAHCEAMLMIEKEFSVKQ